jgi:tetratricopeptide (TPR) repeat protein
MMFVPVMMAILAISFAGCGSEGENGGDNADKLTREGWNLFATGDFSGAVAKFEQAVALDEDLETAYDGLGWAHARLGNLETSLDNFLIVDAIIVRPSVTTFSGMAVVYLALKDYKNAADAANDALDESGGNFQFAYDPSVTDDTMRLIRAICNFHEGLYVSAAADVEALGGPVLNPSSPDFVADVLEAIQEIREEYGQGLLN